MAKRTSARARQRGNQPPRADSDRSFRVGRRWAPWLALLAVLAVATLYWWAGGFASWPTFNAALAMAHWDDEAAEAWITRAEQFNGDAAELQWMRARLRRRRGDFDAMEHHLELARQAGADVQRLRRERWLAVAQTGQLTDIESRLRDWLENPGDDGADLCDAYSNGLAAQGRLSDSEAILEAWQLGFPGDPKPYFKRGRIAEHALMHERAEEEYRAALVRNPSYAPAMHALGRLLLDRNRAEEALPYFRHCAEAAPSAAPASWVGEARCLRQLGRLDEAHALLSRVLALDDSARQAAHARVGFPREGDEAAFELGAIESSRRNFEAAERWLRVAVERDPHDLDARYAWAVALRELDRADEAKAEFEHVARVRAQLATTEKWRENLARNPNDAETRYKIGMVYLKHQSPRLGVYWLRSALACDEQHAPSHAALANYYEARRAESAAYRDLAAFHRAHAAVVGDRLVAEQAEPATRPPATRRPNLPRLPATPEL